MSSLTVQIAPGVTLEPNGWASRLGQALRSARASQQFSLRELARTSNGRFSMRELREFERGRRPVGEVLSRLLADLYHVELETIAPPRRPLEIDLSAGVISAGGATRRLDGNADIVEDALSAYLDLVRALRGAGRNPIEPRAADVVALADALELDEETVVDALAELMRCSKEEARRVLALLRGRSLAVPALLAVAIGVGLATTSVGRDALLDDRSVRRGLSSRPAAAASLRTSQQRPAKALRRSPAQGLVPAVPGSAPGASLSMPARPVNGHLDVDSPARTAHAPAGAVERVAGLPSSSSPGSFSPAIGTTTDIAEPVPVSPVDPAAADATPSQPNVTADEPPTETPAGTTAAAAAPVDSAQPTPGGPPPSPQPDPPRTIIGTPGRDLLTGGSGNDTISALAGNDVVDGSAGDDLVDGGSGNDTLRGSAGNDTLLGGLGNDRLEGGDGDDVADGGPGNDTVLGGAGTDDLRGGAGNDRLDGGVDNDMLDGGAGNDRLDGGAGNDALTGSDGSDTLLGGVGDDRLDGGAGNDRLEGADGDDVADGGPGNDTVLGGAGTDDLRGGVGNDTLDGGDANDVLAGGNGNDTLRGGAGDDRLDGGAGNDRLEGGAGSDVLVGGAGNDTLIGGPGGAVAYGGPGDDVYRTTDGAQDIFFGGSGRDRVVGTVEGSDQIDLNGPEAPPA